MRIPEHNWETGNIEPREYPNELFEPLIVWLLTTSAWHEDHERVERKVINLKRELAAYRNPADSHREAEAWVPRSDPSELEEKAAQINAAEALKQRRRENLARARAAKKAKREAVHASA